MVSENLRYLLELPDSELYLTFSYLKVQRLLFRGQNLDLLALLPEANSELFSAGPERHSKEWKESLIANNVSIFKNQLPDPQKLLHLGNRPTPKMQLAAARLREDCKVYFETELPDQGVMEFLTQKTLTLTFHYFQQAPKEIRRMIWQSFLNTKPRILDLQQSQHAKDVHTILQCVNRES
jgi:hypothetical protein